jgi:hypothetical protein
VQTFRCRARYGPHWTPGRPCHLSKRRPRRSVAGPGRSSSAVVAGATRYSRRLPRIKVLLRPPVRSRWAGSPGPSSVAPPEVASQRADIASEPNRGPSESDRTRNKAEMIMIRMSAAECKTTKFKGNDINNFDIQCSWLVWQ